MVRDVPSTMTDAEILLARTENGFEPWSAASTTRQSRIKDSNVRSVRLPSSVFFQTTLRYYERSAAHYTEAPRITLTASASNKERVRA